MSALLDLFENIKVNASMKFGVLAIFINVFVGITKFILGFMYIFNHDIALSWIILVLETISFALLICFGISLIFISNAFQNQNGLLSAITFLIFLGISYVNVYLTGIFWSFLVILNGMIFLVMFLTLLFFLLALSKKYEEPIILITLVAWLVISIANFFLVAIPVATIGTLIVRDVLTAFCFTVIISAYEGDKKPSSKKEVDYKHVKVKYE